MDCELKRLVHKGTSEAEIRMYLAQSGWRTLRQKALDLVEQGKSTLEEVLRVTRSEALDVGDPTGRGADPLP